MNKLTPERIEEIEAAVAKMKELLLETTKRELRIFTFSHFAEKAIPELLTERREREQEIERVKEIGLKLGVCADIAESENAALKKENERLEGMVENAYLAGHLARPGAIPDDTMKAALSVGAVQSATDRAESAESERDVLREQIEEVREDIRQGVNQATGEAAVERLAGNIIKEEFWKGELSAYRQVEAALNKKASG